MDISDWLKRIEDKLDRMDARSDQRHDRIHDRLNSVDSTLTRQNLVLEDHTRRSLANEESVVLLRTELTARNKANHTVRSFRVTPALIGKAAASLAALGAAAAGVLKAFGKLD